MLRAIIYFHVNIILNVPIKYRNASVFCQSECACLHKSANIVVFFVKINENTYPKGRALMQMYRVVPKTKRGNPSLQYCRGSNSRKTNSCARLGYAPLWFDSSS